MINNYQKIGLYLAFATTLISGVSVFLNKFATAAIKNSAVFTSAKNLLVALVLSLIVLSPSIFKKLKNLTKQDWGKLILIGLIGGSIPFLLFFKGLSLSSSATAAFLHKSLFLWVALLAIPFLKEKLSKLQLSALLILVVGNFLLVGPKFFSFQVADLLIFGAALLWSAEYIIAKKILSTIDSKIVAWARMFFGSVFLVLYLLLIGQASLLLALNGTQWSFIALSALLLLGYVLTWYEALKRLPASVVTSILVLASPITTILNSLFVTHTVPDNLWLPSALIIAGLLLLIRRPQHATSTRVAI